MKKQNKEKVELGFFLGHPIFVEIPLYDSNRKLIDRHIKLVKQVFKQVMKSAEEERKRKNKLI